MWLYEGKLNEINSLPVAVRVSERCVLKLPIMLFGNLFSSISKSTIRC